MIKYFTVAAALKFFSSSSQTKWAYRQLGNTLGQRMRIRRGLNTQRLDRARKILELCKRHQAIKSGDKLIEIGTGWIHWESTIIRLFYDVEITLFDVWDNRQLDAYKLCFRQFEEVVDKELRLDAVQSERAHRLLQVIAQAKSFDQIYTALDFHYVMNPNGTLNQFQDQSFSLIFSYNVLEHIYRRILPDFVRDFYRLLKPNGYSIQVIDLGDHLAYYDKGVCRKYYLRFSDKVWRHLFENDVQYFNRVQRPEWLDLFRSAGFELMAEETKPTNTDGIKIDTAYENLDSRDLQCEVLTLIHRRPKEGGIVRNA
jgi:cyclopropane fatty-acyl-phospholipid synthase-like methyltransferase